MGVCFPFSLKILAYKGKEDEKGRGRRGQEGREGGRG
jgi:hypothetical protein